MAKKGSCLASEPASLLTASQAELQAKILQANFEPSQVRANDFRAGSEPSFFRAFSSYTNEQSRALLGPTPSLKHFKITSLSERLKIVFQWKFFIYPKVANSSRPLLVAASVVTSFNLLSKMDP